MAAAPQVEVVVLSRMQRLAELAGLAAEGAVELAHNYARTSWLATATLASAVITRMPFQVVVQALEQLAAVRSYARTSRLALAILASAAITRMQFQVAAVAPGQLAAASSCVRTFRLAIAISATGVTIPTAVRVLEEAPGQLLLLLLGRRVGISPTGTALAATDVGMLTLGPALALHLRTRRRRQRSLPLSLKLLPRAADLGAAASLHIQRH